jgi:hypothetical protein
MIKLVPGKIPPLDKNKIIKDTKQVKLRFLIYDFLLFMVVYTVDAFVAIDVVEWEFIRKE